MENTIAQAFKVAIQAEHTAEKLYQGLENKFILHKEIASFWRQYALEEHRHAEWLIDLEARQNTEQLSKLADEHTLALMNAVNQFSLENALKNVKDMEDAYQLVMDVENGETNAIFQFLLTNFETDERICDFIRAQLNQHVARLSSELPTGYKSIMIRRTIQAID
jgi:rubrerythrin